MKNNLLPIAKEGFIYIFYAILASVIFSVLDLELFEFISFLSIFVLLFVYRNPERELSVFEQNSVRSPVDGIVLSIKETKGEYSYKVEIDSRYTDVSILRVPMTSILKNIDLRNGARLSRHSSISKKINETVELVYEDNNSNKLKVLHMLKQAFAPIDLRFQESQSLTQGSRYGVMISGVTTIYLPQNFRLNIGVGTEVKASQSLIGYFS